MNKPVYLNVGCGPFKILGFLNSDKEDFDITKLWPYEDKSIDGITSSHVLQELTWRELIPTFREMKRVLKDDGVLRFGVPHVDNGEELDFLLGFGNINLFSRDLLYNVLHQLGYEVVLFPPYEHTFSKHLKITETDNRESETLFVEAFTTREGLR